MAVSKRLRYEILRRDNHACRYCGGIAPDVALTVDHVIPTALGGTDDASNLVSACKDCNAGKSASSPDASIVADVAQDALRWKRAMEAVREADHAEGELIERQRDALTRDFDRLWDEAGLRDSHLPRDYDDSLWQMRNSGLMLRDIRAGCRATSRNVYCKDDWRYFCGVVWNLLSARQDRVVAALAAEDA